MKKILALSLALCLLLSCFPLTVGATSEEENELTVTERVEELLNPKAPSLHVQNGLVFNYVAKSGDPLVLGNGTSLAEKQIFNVPSYQPDSSLYDVTYDYSITGRFSFNDLESTDAFAQIGPLFLSLSKIEGTDTPSMTFQMDALHPSINAEIPSLTADTPISLTVIAKMSPNYVGDGAMLTCNHSFNLVKINDLSYPTEGVFATTNVLTQSLLIGDQAPVNVHSIQVYNRQISELDRQQNIFADVVYNLGVEILNPSYMTDAARTAYITPLISVEDPYALSELEALSLIFQGLEAAAALEDIFDYSSFLLNEAADEWWAYTHNDLMTKATEADWNLTSYFALSDVALEYFYDLCSDVEELTEEELDSLITEAIESAESDLVNPYEELMENLVTFDGYQARLEGNPAIRARFSVDLSVLSKLEDEGYYVTYGATLQNADADVLKINTVYGDDADLAPIYEDEETVRFATMVEAENNTFEECTAEYMFGAFVSVDDGETVYTIVLGCESDLFENETSIMDVCAYFYDNGYESASAVKLGADHKNAAFSPSGTPIATVTAPTTAKKEPTV